MIAAGEPKLDAVLTAAPKEAWQAIFARLWEVFSPPLSVQHVERELAQRERHVADLALLRVRRPERREGKMVSPQRNQGAPKEPGAVGFRAGREIRRAGHRG